MIRPALSVALLVCSILFAPAACTTPVVPTNAITTAETVAETASTVVSTAQAIWPTVYASIPAANQAAAQTAFNEAIFTANHAVLALDDAIQAAIAANTASPDFTAIISQLSGAVAQIVTIVQSFQSAPSVTAHLRTAGGVDAVADIAAASANLKKFGTSKP